MNYTSEIILVKIFTCFLLEQSQISDCSQLLRNIVNCCKSSIRIWPGGNLVGNFKPKGSTRRRKVQFHENVETSHECGGK